LATDLEVATDKGIEIGRAEGMEIGMEKGRAEVESEWKNNTIKTIQNMKNFGMPLSDISAITGLSIDEINELD
jgi:flagellar biosynthesis/type III secretory pathway protein FliH